MEADYQIRAVVANELVLELVDFEVAEGGIRELEVSQRGEAPCRRDRTEETEVIFLLDGQVAYYDDLGTFQRAQSELYFGVLLPHTRINA